VSATSAGTAQGGLRVVEQMFYKIQWLYMAALQQEQKSKRLQQQHCLAAVVAT